MSRPYPPIALYGVTFQDALKTGNKDLIEHIRAHAQDYLDNLDTVKQAYSALAAATKGDRDAVKSLREAAKVEEKSTRGQVIQPLYGVVLHDALKKGDDREIASMLEQAKAYIAEEDRIRELLKKAGG